MSKMDEIIIVVEREKLFENETFAFQGLEKNQRIVNKLMKNISENWTTMRRGDAEENPQYKQPIPYVILRKGSQIFLYKRLIGGGEKRLYNQLSIGIGGHLNPTEYSNFSLILHENLNRELEEELVINTPTPFISQTTIGFINDDLNEVGKVHIGLLVIQDLPESAEVSVRETEVLEGQWVTLHELQQMKDQLETWSKIALEVLK